MTRSSTTWSVASTATELRLSHNLAYARVSQQLTRRLQAADYVPLVIVGNKSDLRPEQRQVTAEDGKALQTELNCGWTEASARYNENVQKAFELMIGEIEKSQNPGEPAGGSKCNVM